MKPKSAKIFSVVSKAQSNHNQDRLNQRAKSHLYKIKRWHLLHQEAHKKLIQWSTCSKKHIITCRNMLIQECKLTMYKTAKISAHLRHKSSFLRMLLWMRNIFLIKFHLPQRIGIVLRRYYLSPCRNLQLVMEIEQVELALILLLLSHLGLMHQV